MDVKEILEGHEKWLHSEGGARALLKDANLKGADLRGINLQSAILQGANLKGANLADANLRYATLDGANLKGANLEGADMYGAYLRYAILQGTNLKGADLQSTSLRGAKLQGANLRGINLRDANLEGANLEGANLKGTNLQNATMEGANLKGVKGLKIMSGPRGGIGWKKVEGGVILKLEITGKWTGSYIGRKCRASEVKVLRAYGASRGEKVFYSMYDRDFIYEIGKTVRVTYDPNPKVECTKGIHFFATKKEAKDY